MTREPARARPKLGAFNASVIRRRQNSSVVRTESFPNTDALLELSVSQAIGSPSQAIGESESSMTNVGELFLMVSVF